jgi:hypothetical protein
MEMQEQVQASVLSLVNRHQHVDSDGVSGECPGADYRDVNRALQLLIRAGLLTWPAVGGRCVPEPQLTALGQARLMRSSAEWAPRDRSRSEG